MGRVINPPKKLRKVSKEIRGKFQPQYSRRMGIIKEYFPIR